MAWVRVRAGRGWVVMVVGGRGLLAGQHVWSRSAQLGTEADERADKVERIWSEFGNKAAGKPRFR